MSFQTPAPASKPPSSSPSISPPNRYDATNPSTASMLQETSRRERCAHILSSWELLAWYSATYGESIPQTRLRFLKQMIGVEEGSEDEEGEGEDGGKGGKGKGKGKEKENGDGGKRRRGAMDLGAEVRE